MPRITAICPGKIALLQPPLRRADRCHRQARPSSFSDRPAHLLTLQPLILFVVTPQSRIIPLSSGLVIGGMLSEVGSILLTKDLPAGLMISTWMNVSAESGSSPTESGGVQPVLALRECIDAGVVGVDAAGCVQLFNPTAEKLVGVTATQVLGRSLESLPPFLRDVLRRTLEHGHPVSHCQVAEASLEGPAFTVTTAVVDGPQGGAVALINDLGAARSVEQKMAQLDRLASIGTLSASMAHEIKNALVAVRTFVELLLKQNKDAELAEIVAREMKRIDSIVSQMLRFAGPAKPTFAPVEVHDVIRHALRLIQHQLEGRKVRLHLELEAPDDLVLGDRYQLQQALVNLLFNALDAMGAQPELRIVTRIIQGPKATATASADNSSLLQVLIHDNGLGIDPLDLPKLFDPFFTTKPNGTGLGLSITRRIVHEHRGSIDVQSEVNQGSSFKVSLPLCKSRI